MSPRPKKKRILRAPRPLLLASSGLAAVAFGANLACGSVVTGTVACNAPDCVGPLGTPIQDGGDAGPSGVQYCGIPDGGALPCYPDGGLMPEGPTDGGIDGGDGG
ncbi:MAG: hypothetical protein JST54_09715 [Deltaproteobacteria bacterium]|nr:hypothetical protein [Deltaproteobacteria bacterium]